MLKINYYLHRLLKQERFNKFDSLIINQNKNCNTLIKEQQDTLNNLINLAANHSSFYSKQFQLQYSSTDRKYDIRSLPILRKDDVIAHSKEMVLNTYKISDLYTGKTGGSTGKPVSFYYNTSSIDMMLAGAYRSYTWAGWKPGDRILHFWGAKQDLRTTLNYKKLISTWITGEHTIGVYEYTEEQLAIWVQAIKQYKPILIQGYASILAVIAQYVLDQDIKFKFNIKGVFSTAEVLYEKQRNIIEKAFYCKVFNQYGSREIPNIACECAYGNFHTFTDMAYVETIQEDNESKLVVTSLTNLVMPFIRYEIGDLGTLKEGDCDCGSPFPMLEMGLCRSNDIIYTKNGKHVYPSYFIHLLDNVNNINQYQFVQENLNRLVLYISYKNKSNINSLNYDELRTRINQDVDPDMDLIVKVVDEIDRTMSGKHRFVINNTGV